MESKEVTKCRICPKECHTHTKDRFDLNGYWGTIAVPVDFYQCPIFRDVVKYTPNRIQHETL